jgi:activator of HSP90 ATPase
MDARAKLSLAIPASSRRHWICGAAVTTAGLVVDSLNAQAIPEVGVSHTAEAIHQEIVFKASAKRIYEALIEAQQFQKIELLSGAMSGAELAAKPAMISRETGGSFSIFADYIIGRQIELLSNQRIVQAWRVVSWAAGVFSIARFELTEQGSATKLVFDHTGFPTGAGDHLASGWRAHYWEPLETFLA